jgi:hypothetical protein
MPSFRLLSLTGKNIKMITSEKELLKGKEGKCCTDLMKSFKIGDLQLIITKTELARYKLRYLFNDDANVEIGDR